MVCHPGNSMTSSSPATCVEKCLADSRRCPDTSRCTQVSGDHGHPPSHTTSPPLHQQEVTFLQENWHRKWWTHFHPPLRALPGVFKQNLEGLCFWFFFFFNQKDVLNSSGAEENVNTWTHPGKILNSVEDIWISSSRWRGWLAPLFLLWEDEGGRSHLGEESVSAFICISVDK